MCEGCLAPLDGERERLELLLELFDQILLRRHLLLLPEGARALLSCLLESSKPTNSLLDPMTVIQPAKLHQIQRKLKIKAMVACLGGFLWQTL